ncbi:MAG: purine-nucleoside phosphorylase [Erysipelotrichales bacterium]|nr:MAG: purine-nucleoside phosphorylase [Erysipelotrichales bacterium]
MSTPHNQATMGQIAKTVLMPGDPLRAKMIAEEYLEDVVQFNSVRNMFGYTGTYKGRRISVMGSGMGIPSIGIYSYELYTQYGVENIIRVGSAGAYTEKVGLFDVILADSAYSESSFAKTAFNYDENIQFPDPELTQRLADAAKDLDIPIHFGRIHSSDAFYRGKDAVTFQPIYRDHQCVAVEMEAFGLFAIARYLNKKAALLVTISDSLVTHVSTTSEERQLSFTKMIEIALEMAV